MTLAIPTERYATLASHACRAPAAPVTPTAKAFVLHRLMPASPACSEQGMALDALSRALLSRAARRDAGGEALAGPLGPAGPAARWAAFTDELALVGAPQVGLVLDIWKELEPIFATVVPDAGMTDDGRVIMEWRTTEHLLSLDVQPDQRVLWYFEDLASETPEANDDPQAWPDIVDAVRSRLALIKRA